MRAEKGPTLVAMTVGRRISRGVDKRATLDHASQPSMFGCLINQSVSGLVWSASNTSGQTTPLPNTGSEGHHAQAHLTNIDHIHNTCYKIADLLCFLKGAGPLQVATQQGYASTTKLLLSYGARVFS